MISKLTLFALTGALLLSVAGPAYAGHDASPYRPSETAYRDVIGMNVKGAPGPAFRQHGTESQIHMSHSDQTGYSSNSG